MPRKKRVPSCRLQRTADPTIFTHPLVNENYVVAGNDGHDAYPFILAYAGESADAAV
jgi:hypothetical protein